MRPTTIYTSFQCVLRMALPLCLATSCCAQQNISSRYSYQDVNYPNSIYSVPLGINNLRVVAGTYIDVHGVFHGFKWRAGTFTQIDNPKGIGTTAGGINDRGDIVGTYIDAKGFQHGYKLASPELCLVEDARPACKQVFTEFDFPGAVQNQIPFELGPGLGTAGIGINDLGEVVGMYAAGVYSNGFVEFRGSYKAIDNPSASHKTGNGTKCFTVSNIGVLACDYITQKTPTSPQITHGFLKDGPLNIPIDFPGADKLGFGTQISGVNIFGTAVGTYFDGATLHALMWVGGKFFIADVPGTPYNELHAINDRGDITGAYGTDPSGQVLRGFVAFPR